MVHELGHVTVGRLFGASSNVLLYSMGGAAIGNFGSIAPWKRILVYAAGPVFGLSLFALVEWGLSPIMFSSFPAFRDNRWYAVVFNRSRIFEEGLLFSAGLPGMLVVLNLFLNLFNLIPVIPLDGGQIMREVVSIIVPRYGLWLAYGLSFLLAGTITVYSVLKIFRPGIPYLPLDPLFNAIIFGMMAFSNLTALRSPAQEEPRRSSPYEEKEW
jgi:stage IV sporulation protein FB